MAATYPADTFQECVDLTIEASNQLAQVVRGDANTEVMVADGSTIPSIRKAQADSMYFKEPELWTTWQSETDYLQLKKYTDPVTNKESWWFAKGALASNPIAMGTSPFGDDNWTLYTPEDLFISGKAEYESVYQALKGKAAEAGYNLVRGSFEEGGTLTGTSDVLWYQANGKYYNWFDGSAKTVVAGSNPILTGGISSTAWVDRSSVTARSSLAEVFGAALVNTSTGETVEDRLSGHDTDITNINNSLSDITNQSHSFRNKIIDGRFDFWYEGTSQTFSGYGSDTMWQNNHSGSTKTHSQQSLVAGVDLPAIDCPSAKYFSRTTVTSVAGVSNSVTKLHKIEGVNTLSGKIVTISFYAKADAVKPLGVSMAQDFGSGGSSPVYIAGQLVSLSSGWARYSLQFQLPSMSGKTIGTNSSLKIFFWFDGGSTIAGTYNISSMVQQSGTFDIACVQLEEGTVATPFEELPIEVNQMRVNRYFQQLNPSGDVPISYMAGTLVVTQTFPLKSTLRTTGSAPAINAVSSTYKSVSGTTKATPTSVLPQITEDLQGYELRFTIPYTTYAAGDFMNLGVTEIITFDARL